MLFSMPNKSIDAVFARWRVAALCSLAVLTACGGGSGADVPSGIATPGNPTTTPGGGSPPLNTPEPPAAPTPTEIGAPIGTAVSATIGAAGGQLTTADGAVSVIVPPGAFNSDRVVAIQEITNHAHGAQGRAFRITPEGLNTPAPMTVRFRYDDDDLVGTALPFMSIAYQDADGVWRRYPQPTVNETERTLSVQTTHFSDWSMVTGVQLLPKSARVRIGESLELIVVYCETEEEESDDEDELIVPLVAHECRPSPAGALTSRNWSVNGIAGGSAGVGSIVANADRLTGKATYTAPAVKPTPNVVAVSAQSSFGEGFQLLVANITIDDALVDCETLRNVQSFDAELSFDQFSFVATAPDHRHTGTHYGRLRGTLQRVQTGSAFGFWISYLTPLTDGRIYANDAYEFTPPSGDGYTGSVDVDSAPHDSLDAPSFIALKVNYDACTFDLFGSFIGDGIGIHDGQRAGTIIGIGGLYIFDQPILIEQSGSLLLQGSLAVQAQDDIESTGYKPFEPASTAWTISGGTTARWNIVAQ